jgi:L-asparaginase
MMQPVALVQQIQNLRNLLSAPPHFLILQGFGTGNLAVNAELIALFDEFYAQGCVVILSTQVPFGRTDQRYAVAAWTTQAKIIVSDCLGHADLYAKALKMYLQYPSAEARFSHWHDLG